jgi:hypothetical protein
MKKHDLPEKVESICCLISGFCSRFLLSVENIANRIDGFYAYAMGFVLLAACFICSSLFSYLLIKQFTV